jgi:hypothetical protein
MRGSPFAAGNKKPRSRTLRGRVISVEVPAAELVPNNDDHAGHRHGTDRHGNGSADGHREAILKDGPVGVKRISAGATQPVPHRFALAAL